VTCDIGKGVLRKCKEKLHFIEREKLSIHRKGNPANEKLEGWEKSSIERIRKYRSEE